MRPGHPARRCYRLAGLLRCGICGRLLESCWSNGKAAYRYRHGHTTVTGPDPARPKNAYIREDQILPRLRALTILICGTVPAGGSQEQCAAHVAIPAGAAEMISYLRARSITLTYDPNEQTLRAGTQDAAAVTVDQKR